VTYRVEFEGDALERLSGLPKAGTRRAYGSYKNRIVEHWENRRLDEPTPSEIRQLMAHVKTHVVARRNARGGRSAAGHLIAALRCLYRHDDPAMTTHRAPGPGRHTAGDAPAANHAP
jgi:integrase/recombinase XerC